MLQNILISYFLGLSNPQNTNVYEEIREYEELKQDEGQKCYQNKEVVNKIYVSLKPMVMERIRDHIRSSVSLTNNITLTTISL